MTKVRLNLHSLSVPAKIQFARKVNMAMSDNQSFQAAKPALAELVAAVGELEAAENDAKTTRELARSKTVVVGEKEEAVNRLLKRLGNLVNDAAEGNEAMIRTAGMEVASDPAPVGPLPQVQNLTATAGDDEGEVDLAWDALRGAASYEMERGPDPNQSGSWTPAGIVTASRATLKGLPSGARLWFRSRAIGAAGPGPWSDPAAKVAP